TGTWTNAASLNTARSRLAAAAAPCVGNGAHTCLYAIGGTGTNGFLSSVEMFDPWTNTWAYEGGLIVSGTSTPYPVAGMAAAAGPCPSDDSRTCLFAWGGQDKTYAILGATMIFDPANNSWSYGPALNTARDNLAGTAAPCG